MKKAYSFSLSVLSIVIGIGFVLQLITGSQDFKDVLWYISAPVNLFLGGIIILLIALFSFFRHSPVYQWFSGIPFAVTLIAALLVFCLFMGLIPQAPETLHEQENKDLYFLLGLRRVNSSWSFVFLYLLLLFSLGMLIARRLIRFNRKDYGFYFNHIGLWITLFAAGLGSADKREYSLYVEEGASESHAYRGDRLSQLPFVIHLNDFDVEEYPLTDFQRAHRIPADPKRFVSDVELTGENGQRTQALIEVNKPLKTGLWSIYQYGYDYEAGKESTYSLFKIVYDPWLPLVYAGIALLAAGAVCMLWSKKTNSKER
jgi:cytochrome c biogenesis factor